MVEKFTTSLLLLFLFVGVEAFAFEPGEKVYVKTEGKSWMSATYVGMKDDCFRLEGPLNKSPSKLETPSEPFLERDVHLSCHVVDRLGGFWAGERYVLAGELKGAADFKKLIGIRNEVTVGDMVYARLKVHVESWSLHKVVAKRDNCYETDSDKVLSDEDIERGILYFPSTTRVGALKDGDTMLIQPSFRSDAWVKIKIKIKAKNKYKLTLLLPYVDADGYFEEQVSIANIRAVPSPLSEKGFLGLKSGMTVLEYIEPAGCDYPYYQPRKIASTKRTCYLLGQGESTEYGETEAYSSEKLISEQVLN